MHRTLVIIILYCAVIAAILFSMAMNFLFSFSLAQSTLTGLLIGGVCIAFDGMKASLSIVIPTLYRKRHWTWMSIAAVLWIGLCIFSMISAIGMVSEERSSRYANRETVAMNYDEISGDIERHKRQRNDLRAHRPAPEVEAAIKVELAKPYGTRTIGQLSNDCKQFDARTNATCAVVAKLQEELAASNEERELDSKIDALQKEARELRERGATKTKDPQKEIVARITFGLVDSAHVVPAIMPILIELISAFGLGLLNIFAEASKQAPQETQNEITQTQTVMLEPASKPRGLVTEYITTRLDPAQDNRALSEAVLYGDYQNWCAHTGCTPMSQSEFIAAFDRVRDERGLRNTIRKRRDRYYGVELLTQQAETAAA